MPIVCALVPSYKVAVARANRPELAGVPLVIADRLERGHAIACDGAAYDLGARTGMTLVQAAACAREAEIIVDDPTRGAALWEGALDALDAASPLIEDAGEGTAYLEMRGIAGTPQRWLGAVRTAFASACTLPLAVAIGPNKFVARAAAQHAAERAKTSAIVRDGEAAAFLAPLPLRYLDFDTATIERLELFGIATLGELAALPHGPFVRRFGPTSGVEHARARGEDPSPLIPRPRALHIDRTLFGEGTAEREEQVLFALRTLVTRVADDVAFAGKRCGFLRLGLECEDASTHDVTTLLAQPTSQARVMFDLLRARLEGIVLAAPVTGLRLGAERLEEGGTALSLFAGSDPDPDTVAIALERLRAALGPDCAQRARIAPGFRYETGAAYEPFPADVLQHGDAFMRAQRTPPAALTSAVATIAYRVQAAREVAVTLERGAPTRVDGRAVLEAAGPWRTNEAWWSEALATDDTAQPHVSCDAYDVYLEGGALVRIACEGHRWFVRGAYD